MTRMRTTTILGEIVRLDERVYGVYVPCKIVLRSELRATYFPTKVWEGVSLVPRSEEEEEDKVPGFSCLRVSKKCPKI